MAVTVCLLVAVAGCGGGGSAAANSGIEGLVLAGPTCPVVRADSPCPDRPIAAPIRIVRVTDSAVTDVQSDDQGEFRVAEAPGKYQVQPLSIGGQSLPAPGAVQEVTVEAGRFAPVTVTYDTGIR